MLPPLKEGGLCLCLFVCLVLFTMLWSQGSFIQFLRNFVQLYSVWDMGRKNGVVKSQKRIPFSYFVLIFHLCSAFSMSRICLHTTVRRLFGWLWRLVAQMMCSEAAICPKWISAMNIFPYFTPKHKRRLVHSSWQYMLVGSIIIIC